MAHHSSGPPGGGGRRNDDSRKRETWPREEPKVKRRRVEQTGAGDEGDWDDIELTQQDLETLDVIASQAAAEPSQAAGHADPEQTLPLVSASIREQQSSFQMPGPSGALPLKGKASTSSSSESSLFPTSSTTLSKTASSDASSAPGSLTAARSSNSSSDRSFGDTSHIVPSLSRPGGSLNGKAVVRDELHRKEEEMRMVKAELERSKREVYARDGEVKFLRDSLRRQEEELEKLREDREVRKEQQAEQQKQKEQELKVENERLQTQIQFHMQESRQLQERYQALEQRLQLLQASPSVSSGPANAAAGVPSTSTPSSPNKSPRRKKFVPAGGASRTPEKGAFPSRQSFMAGPGDVASTSRAVVYASVDAGQTTGPQIVSQLLQCSCSASGEVEDTGVVGLIQMLPSRIHLSGLRFERDSSTLRLSPAKKLKAGEVRRHSSASPTIPAPVPPRPIVSRENFLLAVQGLRNLLDYTAADQQHGTSGSGADPRGSAEGSHQDQMSSTTLILPLLNDYMGHYIDILTSSTNTGPASPNIVSSDSSKSSSGESSLESITSSLGILLQEGAEYANSMETLTMCVLRVLHKLVCMCPKVRSVCLGSRLSISFLQKSTDTSSSTIETDQEKEQRGERSSLVVQNSESGMEGDDEHSSSTSSSNMSLLFSPEHSGSPAARLQGLNILHKLVRLASPSHEGSGYNSLIVQEALRVLIALAEKASDADVDRLNLVVVRGVLTECLTLDQQHDITVLALQLFSQLVRSRAVILFLCNKSETCTLNHVRLVITRLLTDVSSSCNTQTNQIIGLIMSSVVLAMLHLLQEFQTTPDPEILTSLRRGVLLLHQISLWDTKFWIRRGSIIGDYTSLMSGLSYIYKTSPDLPRDETLAMEELWDDQEDEDSDPEEMDTQ
ncbi:hypothetical protein BaRGS_00024451 [Batillaria attramentaria]|uniref:ATR-interacting protein n=1 Tax=Batillaria attramentaria TaxID=370345 RepID=A0ABD0KBG7_9CAEN